MAKVGVRGLTSHSTQYKSFQIRYHKTMTPKQKENTKYNATQGQAVNVRMVCIRYFGVC